MYHVCGFRRFANHLLSSLPFRIGFMGEVEDCITPRVQRARIYIMLKSTINSANQVKGNNL